MLHGFFRDCCLKYHCLVLYVGSTNYDYKTECMLILSSRHFLNVFECSLFNSSRIRDNRLKEYMCAKINPSNIVIIIISHTPYETMYNSIFLAFIICPHTFRMGGNLFISQWIEFSETTDYFLLKLRSKIRYQVRVLENVTFLQ